ncbi:formate dehydrogenase accessory sulfurtransferase FdhD [Siphonobacter aquaeclarae]|uniref:Sulfur carrier protein FdhD n=1 Tax=Siphonobacter aquaeclarae TaxID=563176 RepID=A0A1G9L4L1_9BACT|nr:formate dehydrogenase accessory sulfurtransferase FdhD [Siphonobacter aquaeclarae]SDL56929.1 FdhD protein [Siphonobacter aquaeclarae]
MKTDETVSVIRLGEGRRREEDDYLAPEEPLEIILVWPTSGGWEQVPLTLTMRTPGDDADLVRGLLLTEGLVRSSDDIRHIRVNPYVNQAHAELAGPVTVPHRHFFTSAACGVCGKTGADALLTRVPGPLPPPVPVLDTEILFSLPEKLRSAQPAFDRTGGLHAAALFDLDGQLLAVREDVGRHNAVDKVLGACADRFPMHETVLLLSGRVGFELVQKAAMAGIPVVAAVSAPSSLAVETASACGITLVGFLRGRHANVYSFPERIR